MIMKDEEVTFHQRCLVEPFYSQIKHRLHKLFCYDDMMIEQQVIQSSCLAPSLVSLGGCCSSPAMLTTLGPLIFSGANL